MNDLNVNQEAVDERMAAISYGQFPAPRICWDRADLGTWFRSFALAAGYKGKKRRRVS